MPLENFDFLRDAYRRMQMIRQFEAQAVELSKGDAPPIGGTVHPCAGQEAIPVGAIAALREDDRILATYRGHGWVLEAGITPAEAMHELCHRADGINGGRAGSLMINAPDRRFIGENSIVGAGGPIACGVAIASKVLGTGRVVSVSFGDGAMSQGGLHEAFVMAASQKLPVIFMCENNEWSEMTPTSYTILESLMTRAKAYGMAGEEVDGCDPEAVRAAVARAAERARAGQGPTLLECKVIRLWGHYNRDIEHYRSRQNRAAAAERDPILQLRKKLTANGVAERDLAAIDADVNKVIADAVAGAIKAPLPEPKSVTQHLFSNRVRARSAKVGTAQTMSYAQAVLTALDEELAARPEMVVFGEDVGVPGGVFGLSRDLQTKYGAQRVFDTPIAESAIMGSAVGAAIDGLRPVAEIMFSDFLFVALDQLINQAANVRYVSNGRASAPLVIRTQQGVTPGSCAQHAQCVEGHLANIPGLKVGLPITPQDAYAMLRAAIADPDPCIIIEARSALARMGEVLVGGAVEDCAGARLMRDGGDVAIITWGTSLYPSLEAAETLAALGIEASVLDLRWLSPIDEASIEKVVRKCGRVLVVHEASQTGGFGAEIAARIGEKAFPLLKAPVRRLGGLDVRMPASPVLQREVVPSADKIADIAKQLARHAASAKAG